MANGKKKCKCGIPANSPYHRNGCPPKKERPRILAMIRKDEQDNTRLDAEYREKTAASAAS